MMQYQPERVQIDATNNTERAMLKVQLEFDDYWSGQIDAETAIKNAIEELREVAND